MNESNHDHDSREQTLRIQRNVTRLLDDLSEKIKQHPILMENRINQAIAFVLAVVSTFLVCRLAGIGVGEESPTSHNVVAFVLMCVIFGALAAYLDKGYEARQKNARRKALDRTVSSFNSSFLVGTPERDVAMQVLRQPTRYNERFEFELAYHSLRHFIVPGDKEDAKWFDDNF